MTGAAGFVGSHLVDRLLAEGHEVTGLDDLSSGRLDNLAEARRRKGLSFSRFDCSAGPLRDLVGHARPDAVCHLVRCPDPSGGLRDLVALDAVLGASVAAGVAKVVVASDAGELYGRPGGGPVGERLGLVPVTVRAAAGVAAQAYLSGYRREHGLAATSVVLPQVYGPRDRHGPVTAMARALLAGEAVALPGDGAQQRDWLFVDDAVDALVRSLGAAAAGRRLNAGTGRGTSWGELYRVLAGLVGTKAQPLLGAPGGSGPSLVLDPSAIRRALGWEPFTDLAKGLEATLDWARKQGAR